VKNKSGFLKIVQSYRRFWFLAAKGFGRFDRMAKNKCSPAIF
jgi:hypothetical protein